MSGFSFSINPSSSSSSSAASTPPFGFSSLSRSSSTPSLSFSNSNSSSFSSSSSFLFFSTSSNAFSFGSTPSSSHCFSSAFSLANPSSSSSSSSFASVPSSGFGFSLSSSSYSSSAPSLSFGFGFGSSGSATSLFDASSSSPLFGSSSSSASAPTAAASSASASTPTPTPFSGFSAPSTNVFGSSSSPASSTPAFSIPAFGKTASTSTSSSEASATSTTPVFGQAQSTTSSSTTPLFGAAFTSSSQPQSAATTTTTTTTTSTPLLGVTTSSSSQARTTAATSVFGVSTSASTPATTSVTASTAETSTALVVASSSGAASTAAAESPKLPSEITGKTVEEVIEEWSTELQERTDKFRKQASAIAEWDKRILQNRDVLLKLEIEVTEVVETQSKLEQQLELIETHQQEVDKALQEEEAEHIYKDERGLLSDDQAASTRDALYEQAEFLEREMEQMAEQINSIIQTLNANQGGEINSIDGMSPWDANAQILNNQLSSLMWIDEKDGVGRTELGSSSALPEYLFVRKSKGVVHEQTASLPPILDCSFDRLKHLKEKETVAASCGDNYFCYSDVAEVGRFVDRLDFHRAKSELSHLSVEQGDEAVVSLLIQAIAMVEFQRIRKEQQVDHLKGQLDGFEEEISRLRAEKVQKEAEQAKEEAEKAKTMSTLNKKKKMIELLQIDLNYSYQIIDAAIEEGEKLRDLLRRSEAGRLTVEELLREREETCERNRQELSEKLREAENTIRRLRSGAADRADVGSFDSLGLSLGSALMGGCSEEVTAASSRIDALRIDFINLRRRPPAPLSP